MMDKQKEALVRITGTVQTKYEEVDRYARELHSKIDTLENCYKDSILELDEQFQMLAESLERARTRMMSEIETELAEKMKPLQEHLQTFESAKHDAEDLIAMSNEALDLAAPDQFSQAALRIKERVTMSPIFRLSLCPFDDNAEPECFFYADFAREQNVLNQLKFLPIPSQPEIVKAGCFAENNIVHCLWTIMEEEDNFLSADMPISLCSEQTDRLHLPSSINYFVVQYRQVRTSGENIPWITIECVRSMQCDIKGLIFHQPFLEFRVQAWNKAMGGTWSKVGSISTPAFHFALNPDASHPNLKVISDDVVEWDASSNKVSQDNRIKSASMTRSPSPAKGVTSSSPRRAKPKDRFTGESYTVLADTAFSDEEAYFEVSPHPDCKTYSVGITLKSLARFDQLGKTATSWCIHISSWIQNTFVAKHNNKVKNLDSSGQTPNRYGVYFNLSTGILSFYNAETRRHIHTFKQVKCNGPIVPGFLMWFGSLEVFTGIQVPSWIVTRPSTSLNVKSDSSSTKSNSPVNLASPEEKSSVK
uniref:FSD1-like protein n=1 Tax=Styela clava TaxID=7725 RepID=UPI00193ABEE7|nr:FSD1-like protein [Styela clava]